MIQWNISPKTEHTNPRKRLNLKEFAGVVRKVQKMNQETTPSGGKSTTKAEAAAPARRNVVDPIGTAQEVGVVVPAAAPNHAVGAGIWSLWIVLW